MGIISTGILSERRGVLSENDRDIVLSAMQLAEIREMLADTGYAYDPQQDIFYSTLNPWQRKLGYCSLYDEASAPLGMVFDCEPIRFRYGGKNWLIELWKGQYGITAGSEIGIYTTTGPVLRIPGIFDGTFYTCAEDSDHLSMTYTLLKNKRVLFSRAARHWWLTGFKLGEYAEPSELTMEASITLKDTEMRDAFLSELYDIGYSDREVRYGDKTVLILFSKPHSKQPVTHHGIIGRSALNNLKNNVELYRTLTAGLDNMYDIIMAVKGSAQISDLFLKMGRQKELLTFAEAIKPHIG